MRPSQSSVCLAALVATAVCAAPAHAVTFDRVWGKDVSDAAPTGAEICTDAPHCQAGQVGSLSGEFSSVDGVAVDNSGNVYVADSGNSRVSKFDANGNFVTMWGQAGGAAGDLQQPRDIAVSRGGEVYVADFGNARIDEYQSDGTFVRAWGKNVDGLGGHQCTSSCVSGGITAGPGDEFEGPNGIAVDDTGNVYVVDETARRAQVFDANGGFLFAIGSGVAGGAGPEKCSPPASGCQLGALGVQGGEFDSPSGIAADSIGFYVTDESNQRLDAFSTGGGFVVGIGNGVNGGSGDRCTTAANCATGNTGAAGGQFNNPIGVATDFQGHVYVSDTANNRIQKFDSSLNFMVAFGRGVAGGAGFETCSVAANCQAAPTGAQGGDMNQPAGIASDENGLVFLADASNRRVEEFLDGHSVTPTIDSISPSHRSNTTTPRIVGTAGGAITVNVFANATCSGTPVSGTAAEFASPGIAVTVPSDSVTTFSANAINFSNNTSACSAPVNYTEDSTGPDTTIDSGPSGTVTTATPTFTFHASEAGASFECRFDGAAFGACLGPLGSHTPVLPLADGAHVFEVRALDDLGNPDATPATSTFTVDTGLGKPTTLPPPIEGRLVNAIPVKGVVLVKIEGGRTGKVHAAANGFVPLETVGRQVPVGSTFDTQKGTVLLTAATNTTGATQDGRFSKGQFILGQTKKNPLTTVSMTGGGLNACSKLPRGGSAKPVAAARKHRRSLFSSVKGRFRSRGRNSDATTRGTQWTMTDTCKGTRTSVKSGSLTVHDFTLKKTRTVRAHQSYFARAPLVKKRKKRR